MKNRLMNQKRIFGLLALASVLVISFTGCDETDGDDEDVPGMVLNFTVFPGDREIDVEWEPPLNESGTGQTKGYEVTKDNWKTKQTKKADETSHKFKDLKNDEEYEFKIRAYNSKGRGRESSAKATPSEFANRDPNLDLRTRIYSGKITYKGTYLDGSDAGIETWVYDADGLRVTHISSGGYATVNYCSGKLYAWSTDGSKYVECDFPSNQCKSPDHTVGRYSFYTNKITFAHTRLEGYRLIAGRQCSGYLDITGNTTYYFYRGVLFMQISNGIVREEAVSFSEGFSERDFLPPQGYTKDTSPEAEIFCSRD
jgi:hypothetical protein